MYPVDDKYNGVPILIDLVTEMTWHPTKNQGTKGRLGLEKEHVLALYNASTDYKSQMSKPLSPRKKPNQYGRVMSRTWSVKSSECIDSLDCSDLNKYQKLRENLAADMAWAIK